MAVVLESEDGEKIELRMKSSKRVRKDYADLAPFVATLGKFVRKALVAFKMEKTLLFREL